MRDSFIVSFAITAVFTALFMQVVPSFLVLTNLGEAVLLTVIIGFLIFGFVDKIVQNK
jgi:hypothetical protein